MKIINPSVEILRTGMETEFMTPEQFIEKVGRTCYKSEDKITDDSATKFVGNLIKRGHEAMIEHWNLIYRFASYGDLMNFQDSKKSIEETTGILFRLRVTDREDDGGNHYSYVSGNFRAWRDYIKAWHDKIGFIPHELFTPIRDNPLFFHEFIDYIPENYNFFNTALIPVSVNDLEWPERLVHQVVTVKFICDRGVSHEIVRHRSASFAQESTRYCNYSGEKYGREITVVRPSWKRTGVTDAIWMDGCGKAEAAYFDLLDAGHTPQEARSVLPNSLKTEVIMSDNLNGWDHFFDLRCATSAHPDMQVVANMLREEFEKLDLHKEVV